MYLRPSEIFYSQDSINNVFAKWCNHAHKHIGETLDEVCEGSCSVNNIPSIIVVQEDGKWVTADNRRLWVFRQLERLGKCEKIPVQKGYYIPDDKRTTNNGGESVRVRGSPGGYWHRKPSVTKYPKNVQKAYIPTYQPSGIGSNSSYQKPPDFNNQFSRASGSHHSVYDNYGTTTGADPYRNRMNTNNAYNIGTTSMFPKESSAVRESSVAYKYGTHSNFNHDGLDKFGRNSDIRTYESNMPTGVTYNERFSSVSRSGLTYPTGKSSLTSSSSSSQRESVNKSKARNDYRARETNTENEERVYRHKTYDRSYTGGRRQDRDRDNGCCVIL